MISEKRNVRAGRLLVVEDQDSMAETITSFLTREGFDVKHVDSLAHARECLSRDSFDLVILDITLPDGDGRHLLPVVEQKGGTGVVIISGRGAEHDRIFSLEAGADDYLVKPFSLRELAARVRGVLRRIQAPTPARDKEEYHFGPFHLDRHQRSLTHQDRGEIPLTTAEFEVLLCLASNSPGIASRETLTQEALGRPWHPLDRSVDQIIVFLRRKLEEDNNGVRIITVRGRGYLLRAGAAGEKQPF